MFMTIGQMSTASLRKIKCNYSFFHLLNFRQDVVLIGGEERDGWTRIEFSRPLKSGNVNDRDFETTERVLWVRFPF